MLWYLFGRIADKEGSRSDFVAVGQVVTCFGSKDWELRIRKEGDRAFIFVASAKGKFERVEDGKWHAVAVKSSLKSLSQDTMCLGTSLGGQSRCT
ncbi:unnamed protein product [Dovyalis caffra]|uniref:Uncharacterized protein n=1 Tax=Dovyalis caffra TaxID=77055 RepID=A0AAV1SBB9_9ROSI|nr:unnamed protein product [Dovyalis caffra]